MRLIPLLLLALVAACAGKTKTAETGPVANSSEPTTYEYAEEEAAAEPEPEPGPTSGPTSGPTVGQTSGSKAEIRRTIQRDRNKLQYCYEKELLNNPNLQGTVMVDFAIAPDGAVSQATATGLPPVDACVQMVFLAMKFPPTGGVIQVRYPIVFQASP